MSHLSLMGTLVQHHHTMGELGVVQICFNTVHPSLFSGQKKRTKLKPQEKILSHFVITEWWLSDSDFHPGHVISISLCHRQPRPVQSRPCYGPGPGRQRQSSRNSCGRGAHCLWELQGRTGGWRGPREVCGPSRVEPGLLTVLCPCVFFYFFVCLFLFLIPVYVIMKILFEVWSHSYFLWIDTPRCWCCC